MNGRTRTQMKANLWESIPCLLRPPPLKWVANRIKRWLWACNESHSSCNLPKSTPLPTRVIDVGSPNVQPRLYTTSGESARYITLSHRWASPESRSKRLMTTKSNIASMCSGIPIDDLPKTFLEAVEVTRALGIQYLWIDSLCVIQNDAQDKAHEVNLMMDVYSNAYLTLAADWSPHSDGGLYVSPRTIRSGIDVPDSSGNEHEILIGGAFDSAEYENCKARHNVSVLNTRGWVLQERILSHRTVRFGSYELQWTCAELEGCQCERSPSPPKDYEPLVPGLETHFRELMEAFGHRDTLHLVHRSLARRWNAIVSDYSQRELTFDEDRLSAIAGIAGKIPILRDDYVAGMWQVWLKASLGWYTPLLPNWATKEHVRMPPSYAPSWSWASVIAPVMFSFTETSDFHCVRINLEAVDASPDVPYDTVRLVARGYLVPCILGITSGLSVPWIPEGPCLEYMSEGIHIDTGWMSTDWEDRQLSLFLISADRGGSVSFLSTHWLLLQLDESGEREIYTRFGFVKLQHTVQEYHAILRGLGRRSVVRIV
ncbi:heterokaryon incompatibility protein-domain-containing protein [Lophiotrema nucula]|uniref:Heterokaryon incompatibility protein-domain-containing protein n=1 Tax=Lophiotrema nucula TaxID=690887 RepID=A0A6A5YVF2_9PLEO|nr:heterokaryon incompatibility protein-domain-containing protein [Lophiotrema nucula]